MHSFYQDLSEKNVFESSILHLRLIHVTKLYCFNAPCWYACKLNQADFLVVSSFLHRPCFSGWKGLWAMASFPVSTCDSLHLSTSLHVSLYISLHLYMWLSVLLCLYWEILQAWQATSQHVLVPWTLLDWVPLTVGNYLSHNLYSRYHNHTFTQIIHHVKTYYVLSIAAPENSPPVYFHQYNQHDCLLRECHRGWCQRALT